MRINQIARNYGLDNKEILDYLESIGVHGKSHSSSLDDGTLELMLGHFGKLETKETEPDLPASNKFVRIRRPKGWKPTEKESLEFPIETVAPPQVVSPAAKEKGIPSEKKIAEAAIVSPTGLSPASSPVTEIKPPSAQESAAPAEMAAVKTPPSEKEAALHRKELKLVKPAEKKAKPKPAKLEKDEARPVIEPEIIIVAPEIDLQKLEQAPLGVEPVAGKEKFGKEAAVRHDQDEAIRKEIQKLKLKQKRIPLPEETKAATVMRPERRREPAVRGKGKRAWKKEKRERREMQIAAEEQKKQQEKSVLKVHDATTVADVASGLGISPNELIQKLIGLGVMATINQRIDMDTVQIVADEYGFAVEKVDLYDSAVISHLWEADTDESRKIPRPPVVTIMGHVDHGKTKLLDCVRSSDIVSQEAGGITQHIGAYYVITPGGDIVFLDTPGHEAFTAMRARGAMVTDIVVLVVAASEGVMPQTIEAIHHAKAAGVPIIVAINKIDLDNANPDIVKQQLVEQGLVSEEWGGNTVMALISAKQKIGIDALLESILLQAELLELKADPDCRARGTIIEGRLEPGRGAVATVLLQEGRLKVSDPFVTGVYSGRVRAMMNDRGEPLQIAGPSMPVEILGLDNVPSAGDPFIVVEDDAQAKQISARLQQIQRERDLRRTHHVTLEDLHIQIEQGAVKELNIIIKGDVQGSVGALCENLAKITSEKVRIEIIHSGVGSITESDVMLASASNALIIGFNVRPHPNVMDLSKREHVDIRMYRVIYDAISDIKKAMTGMLDKTYREKIIGRGEIREVYRLSRSLSIAGSFVQDGRLLRNSPVRLVRDSVVVHEGRLSSLKRFKDDVREVASGYECGIGLERFNDIRVGDIVECYQMEEVAPTL